MSNRVAGFMSGAPRECPDASWTDLPVKRADLHCHSNASNEADEVMLEAIGCPESFSDPLEVYAQAKSRSMDFVAITDHDSLKGVMQIADKPDHLVGEELTCYFPEDHCKIHILVWGLSNEDHAALQAVASDIYKVAELIETRNLAHAVAHPVYRQNDRLEKWHLERLVLMFKGFETLNGAHSVLHRQAIEPLLDSLSPAMITEFSTRHGLLPRWPLPHVKARTGGSDDHGLFNIGRTWTEFPGDVQTVDQLLECLRTGRCRPGGEAGSSLKLAHNFYGVGIRYYGQRLTTQSTGGSLHSMLLGTLIGGSLTGKRRSPRRRDWMKAAVVNKARQLGRRITSPFRSQPKPTGSALLLDLFLSAASKRFAEHEALGEAITSGRAVLGEHSAMFSFLSDVNRDIAAGIAESVTRSLDRKELTGVFDAVSAIAAHQFLLMPYYFALFHQNRERQLLPRITGHGSTLTTDGMKLGVFTDTFDEINGVGRFIQDMCRQAQAAGRTMIVHTSTNNPTVVSPARKNFKPMLSRPLPYYPDQPLSIPPLAEVLEWADRQQFDAIHVHTPGPMGLCGWLVARMLRVPLLGTYHTDFPGYVQNLTGDYRSTTAATAYMKWFYGQTQSTFSRSKEYRGKLREMGFADEKLTMTLPGVDNEKFSPQARDPKIWETRGIKETYKLFYAGRVSLEKNLPFLADAFKRLCAHRNDVALVIAGDGPYAAAMQQSLQGLPAYFLGYQNDTTLPGLYASSDLFVFPSKTDTLGQVVLEAQASGTPVLVSNIGGPREVTDDGITGLVLPAEDPTVWVAAIERLLNDSAERMRMGRSATLRMVRYSLKHAFESFWDEHVNAAQRMNVEQAVQVRSPEPEIAIR
jgi:glycosyltransferase involved in cell wall biosynthesis